MPMDYHVPLYAGQRYIGDLLVSYSLSSILEEMVPWWFAQDNEIAFTSNDDAVFAKRAAGGPGRNVYIHRHMLELPGATVYLRTNSVKNSCRMTMAPTAKLHIVTITPTSIPPTAATPIASLPLAKA